MDHGWAILDAPGLFSDLGNMDGGGVHWNKFERLRRTYGVLWSDMQCVGMIWKIVACAQLISALGCVKVGPLVKV